MADEDALGREYLLHEEIGRGSLAVVRRATSRFGGPPLAAKLLKPEYADNRRVRELFIREEAALRDLEHPSIVGIRDLVVERGRLALLMDYVHGPNLRRYLSERGGRLPVTEAAWIGAQTAAALAVAHAQGVVHLDLKPENILVVAGTDPVRIRISDFGVAALLLDADRQAVGGTPGYVAPEVQHGGAATAAADVYALGVVLREMLGDEVPEPLATLIGTCLDPDPRARPSARALAVHLRRTGTATATPVPGPAPEPALPDSGQRDTRLRNGGAPPVDEPPPPAEPSRSRWRRGPLITLGAGVVVAGVIAGLTVNAAADQHRAVNNAAIIPAITAGTSAPPTSAAPPVSKPPTEDLAESPPPDRTRATFAGHVDDGGGTLAISLRDGVAIAYICDGKRVEAWLKGTAANGKLTMTGKGGATIDGTFDSRRARGEVTTKGRTDTFSIAVAKKPSGLYRAAARVRNAEVVGSWIVLPDGSQVGVMTDDGVPGPAPALDVTGRATTVDGTRVTASTIDVDTGEGF